MAVVISEFEVTSPPPEPALASPTPEPRVRPPTLGPVELSIALRQQLERIARVYAD